MRLVGLTGGIATGKSTVSKLLLLEGVKVVDCDKIAHDVARKGRWGWRRTVTAFGSEVLSPDGEIDRDALGKIVFNDVKARKKLNKATHLPVFVEMFRQLFCNWLSCERAVVIDMPLLFETRSDRFMQISVCVHCSEHTQLKRLLDRNDLSEADAKSRIAAQMPLEKKKGMADILIDNSGPKEELKDKVKGVIHEIKRGSWKHWLISPPFLAFLVAACTIPLFF